MNHTVENTLPNMVDVSNPKMLTPNFSKPIDMPFIHKLFQKIYEISD